MAKPFPQTDLPRSLRGGSYEWDFVTVGAILEEDYFEPAPTSGTTYDEAVGFAVSAGVTEAGVAGMVLADSIDFLASFTGEVASTLSAAALAEIAASFAAEAVLVLPSLRQVAFVGAITTAIPIEAIVERAEQLSGATAPAQAQLESALDASRNLEGSLQLEVRLSGIVREN